MSAASGGRQWHDREGPQGRASLPQSPRVAGAGLCPGQYRGIRGQAGPRPAPDGTGARAAAPGRALGPVRHEIFVPNGTWRLSWWPCIASPSQNQDRPCRQIGAGWWT